MIRRSLTLRALVLVPLLAAGVDQARAGIACGSDAASCLEAAGQGWLGAAGPLLLIAYALALALGVARLVARAARPHAAGPAHAPAGGSFAARWLVGTAGVLAVCGGQALLTDALGDGRGLGGGWPLLVLLAVLAGALIAAALRVPPAAEALVRRLAPAAPRALPVAASAAEPPAPAPRRTGRVLLLAAHGRAPPGLALAAR